MATATRNVGWWFVKNTPTTGVYKTYPAGQRPPEYATGNAVYVGPNVQDAVKYGAYAAQKLGVRDITANRQAHDTVTAWDVMQAAGAFTGATVLPGAIASASEVAAATGVDAAGTSAASAGGAGSGAATGTATGAGAAAAETAVGASAAATAAGALLAILSLNNLVRLLEVVVGSVLLFMGLRALTGTGSGNPVTLAMNTAAKAPKVAAAAL